MAKTKSVRDKSRKSGASSSKSSTQGTSSSSRSGDKDGNAGGRMRNRKKSAPDLYKTRHNIGRRSAAGRVASYSETEVTLHYPEGFFRPVVKVEMGDIDRDGGNNSNSGDRQMTPRDNHRNTKEESKASRDSGLLSDASVSKKSSTKARSVSPPTKGKDISKSGSKTTAKKDKSPQKKGSEAKVSGGKTTAEASCNKETKSSGDKGKVTKAKVKHGKDGDKASGVKDLVKKGKISSKQSKDSDKSASSSPVRQTKESVNDSKPSAAKKRKEAETKKLPNKSKGATKSNKLGSAKKSKFSGILPRAPRIKRTACLNAGAIMSAMYKDEPIIKKPKIEQPTTSSDKTQSENKDSKGPQSPKKQDLEKPHSPKKAESPKRKEVAKSKMSGKELKKVVKMDLGKKVKVKMKAKEKVKGRVKVIRKSKVKVVDSSSEEESEKEEDIPLWPPPRRMASLNALAFLSVSREDRISRPRKAGNRKSGKKATTNEPIQSTADGEGKTDKKDDKEEETSPQKSEVPKSVVVNDSEKPPTKPTSEVICQPPVTQALPPATHNSSIQQTVPIRPMGRPEQHIVQPIKPNLPNQSPDLQILEVKPPSFSGASVSRTNNSGNYSSHSTPHPRPNQGPVPFMPSSSSSFNYAIPSGHSSHGNQGRYPGPPVQQAVPPHAGGYPIQHQAQRSYQTGHMPYHAQQQSHGQGMMPTRPQHSPQKLYPQSHQQASTQHAQGQHLSQSHPPYPSHQQAGSHRPPMPTQSQTPFQQQQQQNHHHQMPSYQTSLTPHSSQTPLPHTQSFHHQSYPMQQNHPRLPMPVAGHHTMGPGGVYPPGPPTPLTKPKLEPPCSTPGPRFQAMGPKPEKPLTSYSAMPGAQGSSNQQGSSHNQPHGPSPMGNTCTYPYPHSNHGNSQSDQCQSYMMSPVPVDNNATYTMMSFRHFGSAFALHSFDEQQHEHTTFGKGFFQPAGPMIQTMPHDPCCMPDHMAMLVPRPQVKVLVHNTGGYPPSYGPIPASSQPAIPAKPAEIRTLRSPSPEDIDKSRSSTSPLKKTKEANLEKKAVKDPKVDVSKKCSKNEKESDDDGKVFTILEVATKKPKNANGRELLAQRTKISSDSLLLEPIISAKSLDVATPGDQAEDEANNKKSTAPVPQASIPKAPVVGPISNQNQPTADKTPKGPDKKDSKKETPKTKGKKKETKSMEKPTDIKVTNKVIAAPATVSQTTLTTSTIYTGSSSPMSAINTQAKLSSNIMTVVSSNASISKGSAKVNTVKSTKSASVNVPIAPKPSMSSAEVLPVTTVTNSSTANTTVSSKPATQTKTTNKRGKLTKEAKTKESTSSVSSLSSAMPAVVSSEVAKSAATATVSMATKSTSTDTKGTSRKRKSVGTTGVAVTDTTVATSVTSTPVEAPPSKAKAISSAKSPGGKKAKLSTVSSVAKDTTTTTSVITPMTTATTTTQVMTSAPAMKVGTKATNVPSSTAAFSTLSTSSIVPVTSAVFTTASKTTQCRMAAKGSKASVVTSMLMPTTTCTVNSATDPVLANKTLVAPVLVSTPLAPPTVFGPTLDVKTAAQTILPQGTVLLSNPAGPNQPVLMSTIANPGRVLPGHLPMVSMTANQIVTPVFLPAKTVPSTTGAATCMSASTAIPATTTVAAACGLPTNISNQTRMPFIQGQFPGAAGNIALSSPVFLSIPQPNSMGQTFLQLGAPRPTLQQIHVPMVSHQQVMVSQGTQVIKPVLPQGLVDTKSTIQGGSAAQNKPVVTGTSASDGDAKNVKNAKKVRKKKAVSKNEPVVAKKASNKASTKTSAKGKVQKAKEKSVSATKEISVSTTKKKAAKGKLASSVSVATSNVIAAITSVTTSLGSSSVKPALASTGLVSSVSQVPCSSPPIRASTAPLLASPTQSIQIQGKVAISHGVDLSKGQTPLEMLQTVARKIQQMESQAKTANLPITATVSPKAQTSRSASAGCVEKHLAQKVDDTGALDLVLPTGSSSKPPNVKGRSSRVTAPKGKSAKSNLSTPDKSAARSLSESAAVSPAVVGMVSPQPATPMRSPLPMTPFSLRFIPPSSPVVEKPGSSYEDLIQDLSMPRQQSSVTPAKESGAKDAENIRDHGTPIDLTKKSKITKSTSSLQKADGTKKSTSRKSKQSTSANSKQSSAKSVSSPGQASSIRMTTPPVSRMPSATATAPRFQIIAGIQIPVMEKKPAKLPAAVPSNPGALKTQSPMSTPRKASPKSSTVHKTSSPVEAVVTTASTIETVGASKTVKTGSPMKAHVTPSESYSKDKPPEKITPTKSFCSRGFQLSEVVERLHQANKEASDHSDKSDGECSSSRCSKGKGEDKLITATGLHQCDTGSASVSDSSCTKVPGQSTIDGLAAKTCVDSIQSDSGKVSHDAPVSNSELDKSGNLADRSQSEKDNWKSGNDSCVSVEDSEDEDALFIDMDCDPSDNKPSSNCSDEADIVTDAKVQSEDNISSDVVRDSKPGTVDNIELLNQNAPLLQAKERDVGSKDNSSVKTNSENFPISCKDDKEVKSTVHTQMEVDLTKLGDGCLHVQSDDTPVENSVVPVLETYEIHDIAEPSNKTNDIKNSNKGDQEDTNVVNQQNKSSSVATAQGGATTGNKVTSSLSKTYVEDSTSQTAKLEGNNTSSEHIKADLDTPNANDKSKQADTMPHSHNTKEDISANNDDEKCVNPDDCIKTVLDKESGNKVESKTSLKDISVKVKEDLIQDLKVKEVVMAIDTLVNSSTLMKPMTPSTDGSTPKEVGVLGNPTKNTDVVDYKQADVEENPAQVKDEATAIEKIGDILQKDEEVVAETTEEIAKHTDDIKGQELGPTEQLEQSNKPSKLQEADALTKSSESNAGSTNLPETNSNSDQQIKSKMDDKQPETSTIDSYQHKLEVEVEETCSKSKEMDELNANTEHDKPFITTSGKQKDAVEDDHQEETTQEYGQLEDQCESQVQSADATQVLIEPKEIEQPGNKLEETEQIEKTNEPSEVKFETLEESQIKSDEKNSVSDEPKKTETSDSEKDTQIETAETTQQSEVTSEKYENLETIFADNKTFDITDNEILCEDSKETDKEETMNNKQELDDSAITELTIICEDDINSLGTEYTCIGASERVVTHNMDNGNPSNEKPSPSRCRRSLSVSPTPSPKWSSSCKRAVGTEDEMCSNNPKGSPNGCKRDHSTLSPKSNPGHSPDPRTSSNGNPTSRDSPGSPNENSRRALSSKHSPTNGRKSSDDNPRRTSPRVQAASSSKKEELTILTDDTSKRTLPGSKRKEDHPNESPPAKRALVSPKRRDDKKAGGEQKKASPSAKKKEEKLYKPWSWEGEPEMKPVYTQVEGPPVSMLCYPAMRHDDGDLISLRDCVLVKSGPRKSDIPYVAKIGALFENVETKEMMMSVLWYYRAEHTETERLPQYIDSEIFASKHRDIIPAVCIDDKCYVLTFNEFCRYRGEQKRMIQGCVPRDNVIPLLKPTQTPKAHEHVPPLTASTETVFLSRRVYDVKLKRILKNPQVHIAPTLS